MISEHLIPKLQKEFSDRRLRVGVPPESCAIFPTVHSEVGDIEICDDGDELTVYLGTFTHRHFGNYDEKLSKGQAAEAIAQDVVAFLKEVFADRIVMWGSHRGVGGFYRRGKGHRLGLIRRRRKEYVWSGPISTEN